VRRGEGGSRHAASRTPDAEQDHIRAGKPSGLRVLHGDLVVDRLSGCAIGPSSSFPLTSLFGSAGSGSRLAPQRSAATPAARISQGLWEPGARAAGGGAAVRGEVRRRPRAARGPRPRVSPADARR
jgi:hypothetical protein